MPELMPEQAYGGPELFAALAKAIAQAKGVGKDGTNTHHGYDYVSAEGIFQAGRQALADNGLSLIPAGYFIVESESTSGRDLLRKVRLCHSSGQWLEISAPHWPIVIRNGHPFDKALPSAMTASLRWIVRDLLLIPQLSNKPAGNRQESTHWDETDHLEELRRRVLNDALRLPDKFRPTAQKDVRAARTLDDLHAIGVKVIKALENLEEAKPEEEPEPEPHPQDVGPTDLEQAHDNACWWISKLPTEEVEAWAERLKAATGLQEVEAVSDEACELVQTLDAKAKAEAAQEVKA